MNYKRIYNNLINHYQTNPPEGYSERHHIVPRCIGGSNNSSNLVRLPAKAHYISHRLLHKIYPTNLSLWSAWNMMRSWAPYNQFEQFRINHAKKISEVMRGKKLSDEHKAKISAKISGSKNYQHIGMWITPKGKFDNSLDAARANGINNASNLRYKCKKGINGYSLARIEEETEELVLPEPVKSKTININISGIKF